MTLQQELAALEQQRTATARSAEFEYARLKRDVRRAISPDRFVRKHIAAILAAAFAAGMVAAPAAGSSPGAAQESPAGPARTSPPKRGFFRGLVAKMASRAAANVDWMRVGTALLERYMARSAENTSSHHDGQNPGQNPGPTPAGPPQPEPPL